MGIAMVLQTPQHFSSMTVLENVVLGALFGRVGGHRKGGLALELAEVALSFVGLADRRHDPVGSLNLHEQRFLELARAIAGQPRLLVLDEVMAGLNDAELEASIDIIRTIRDQLNVTIIWVEHVMKAVMSLAERTVVLNFGDILTEGLPKDVMRHPAVVEAYLGKEIKHA
jgi:ABC-type branched-subunit amino acid transport system ATPase component